MWAIGTRIAERIHFHLVKSKDSPQFACSHALPMAFFFCPLLDYFSREPIGANRLYENDKVVVSRADECTQNSLRLLFFTRRQNLRGDLWAFDSSLRILFFCLYFVVIKKNLGLRTLETFPYFFCPLKKNQRNSCACHLQLASASTLNCYIGAAADDDLVEDPD